MDEIRRIKGAVGSRLRGFRRSMNPLAEQLDWWVGRRVLGIDNPASYAIRGANELRRFRTGRTDSRVLEKPSFDVRKLGSNGMVVVDEEVPDTVKLEVARQVADGFGEAESWVPRGSQATNGEYFSRLMLKPWEVAPAILELLTPGIVAGIEAYYQAHLEVVAINCWRNFHFPSAFAPPGRERFNDRWHCDHRFTTMLKLFYLVHDTGPDDGPFMIQPRPRTQHLLRRGFGSRSDYSLPLDTVEDHRFTVQLTGKAGTMLICNTTVCLHRASNPAPGRHRDIVQYQFFPGSKPLADDWWKYISDAGLGARGR